MKENRKREFFNKKVDYLQYSPGGSPITAERAYASSAEAKEVKDEDVKSAEWFGDMSDAAFSEVLKDAHFTSDSIPGHFEEARRRVLDARDSTCHTKMVVLKNLQLDSDLLKGLLHFAASDSFHNNSTRSSRLTSANEITDLQGGDYDGKLRKRSDSTGSVESTSSLEMESFPRYTAVLNLSGNKFADLPQEMAGFERLETLKLCSNEHLRHIPEVLLRIGTLHSLHLRNCNIATWPQLSDGTLCNLKFLNLRDNVLTNVPHCIGKLTCLKRLYLDSNRISHIEDGIRHCASLEQLLLSRNKLETLPEGILHLPRLFRLNLAWNSLNATTRSFFAKAQKMGFGSHSRFDIKFLDGLSDIDSNKELIESSGLDRKYWVCPWSDMTSNFSTRDTEDKRNAEINSGRVVFLGECDAGKTTIISALRCESADKHEDLSIRRSDDTTRISITSDVGHRDFDAKIEFWDLPGQAIYRATHQLFINSSKALYIITFDVTNNGFKKILEQMRFYSDSVQSRAPGAKTIFVANKTDILVGDNAKVDLREDLRQGWEAFTQMQRDRLASQKKELQTMRECGNEHYQRKLRRSKEQEIFVNWLREWEDMTTGVQSAPILCTSAIDRTNIDLLKTLIFTSLHGTPSSKTLRKEPKEMAIVRKVCHEVRGSGVVDFDTFFLKYLEHASQAGTKASSATADIRALKKNLKFWLSSLNDCESQLFFPNIGMLFPHPDVLAQLINVLVYHHHKGNPMPRHLRKDEKDYADKALLTEELFRERFGQLCLSGGEESTFSMFKNLMQSIHVVLPLDQTDQKMVKYLVPCRLKEFNGSSLTQPWPWPIKKKERSLVAMRIQFRDGFIPDSIIQRAAAYLVSEKGFKMSSRNCYRSHMHVHYNKKRGSANRTSVYLRSVGGNEGERMIDSFNFVDIYVVANQDINSSSSSLADETVGICSTLVAVSEAFGMLLRSFPGVDYEHLLALCPACTRENCDLGPEDRNHWIMGHDEDYSDSSTCGHCQEDVCMEYFDCIDIAASSFANALHGSNVEPLDMTNSLSSRIRSATYKSVLRIGLYSLKDEKIVVWLSGVFIDEESLLVATCSHGIFLFGEQKYDSFGFHSCDGRALEADDIKIFVAVASEERKSPQWKYVACVHSAQRQAQADAARARERGREPSDIMILRLISRIQVEEDSSHTAPRIKAGGEEPISAHISTIASELCAIPPMYSTPSNLTNFHIMGYEAFQVPNAGFRFDFEPKIIQRSGTTASAVPCCQSDEGDILNLDCNVRVGPGMSGGPVIAETTDGYAVVGIIFCDASGQAGGTYATGMVQAKEMVASYKNMSYYKRR
eukprot:g2784.t1